MATLIASSDLAIRCLTDEENSDDEALLRLIAEAYSKGYTFERQMFERPRRKHLSPATAAQTLASPARYPAFLIGWAEESTHLRVSASVVPVAMLAEKEGWTFS